MSEAGPVNHRARLIGSIALCLLLLAAVEGLHSLRIVLLGASIPFGFGLPGDQVLAHFLEQLLRSVIEPETGEGVSQIYGGMSPEGLVRMGLLALAFPLPDALADKTFADIELRAEHWGVVSAGGRSLTAGFLLNRLACSAQH
jgi:hypothetical protein